MKTLKLSHWPTFNNFSSLSLNTGNVYLSQASVVAGSTNITNGLSTILNNLVTTSSLFLTSIRNKPPTTSFYNFNDIIGSNGEINAIELVAPNKLLVGGNFTKFNGATHNNLVMIDFDGNIDTSFNSGTGLNGPVTFIKKLSDNTILVGGNFTKYNNNYIANNLSKHDSVFNIDTNFLNTVSDGVNGIIRTIGVQSDGKVVIGGSFTQYKTNTCNYIARINPDGTYDTSFLGGTRFDGEVRKILILSDDKIVATGTFSSYSGSARSRIVRLNPDGSIDNTFSVGSGFNGDTWPVELQPDGKILVGGWFTNYNGNSCNRLARLNTNGSFDTTFNVGGGFDDAVYAIKVQPSGKVLVGGDFTVCDGNSVRRMARLNSDGSFDNTFDLESGFSGQVRDIKLDNNNKILVAGRFKAGARWSYGAAMFDPADNFRPDASFAPKFGFNGNVYSSVLLPNDELVVLGSFTSYQNQPFNRIVKIFANGSIDTTFNVGNGFSGTQTTSGAVQTDGKIVVVGNFTHYNANARNNIVRLNADGSIDTTFNVGTGLNAIGRIVKIQPDGKILVGGNFTDYDGNSVDRLIRLNTDGSLDSSFSVSLNDEVMDLVVQPDGKILIGGKFTQCNSVTRKYIVRINSDGSLDTSFVPASLDGTTVHHIFLRNDGKIIISGDIGLSGFPITHKIVRLNPNGSNDGSFLFSNLPSAYSFNKGGPGTVYFSHELNDGSLVVGGQFESLDGFRRWGLFRCYPNGFVNDHTSQRFCLFFESVSGDVFSTVVRHCNVLSNGKLFVVGNFNISVNFPCIVRLNQNGDLDTSFRGIDLDNLLFFYNQKPTATTVCVLPDDKILVGGLLQIINNDTTHFGIVQLLPDGSVDSNSNNQLQFNKTNFSPGHIFAIERTNSGHIYVAGDFNVATYFENRNIIRLNLNGTRVNVRNFNCGFNDVPTDAVELPGNKIVIVGHFREYNSKVYYNHLVQIDSNGEPNINFYTGGREGGILFDTSEQSYITSVDYRPTNDLILIGGKFGRWHLSPGVYNFCGLKDTGVTNSGVVEQFNVGVVGTNSSVTSIKNLSNDAVMVVGRFSQTYSTVKIFKNILKTLPNLAVDDNFQSFFGTSGSIHNTIGPDESPIKILETPTGEIFLMGNFNKYEMFSAPGIVKINANGAIANDFKLNAIVDPNILGQPRFKNGVIANNSLFLVGFFQQNSILLKNPNNIVRLGLSHVQITDSISVPANQIINNTSFKIICEHYFGDMLIDYIFI